MNKKTILTALLAAILGLASCNRDSNYEDKVEQVIVYVSAETVFMYLLKQVCFIMFLTPRSKKG